MKSKVFCLILGGLLMAAPSSFACLAELAPVETKIWQAYYNKDFPAAQAQLKRFIELQYQVEDAASIVPGFLQSMAQFGMMPISTSKADYDKEILPILTKALEDISKLSSLKFDPETLAKAELAWWVARRDAEQLNPENVGKLIARTYGLLYGEKDENYMKAGYLRASAARYRDLCQDSFPGGVTDADWALVEKMLQICYENLEASLKAK